MPIRMSFRSVQRLLEIYSRGEDAGGTSPYRAMGYSELLEAWRDGRRNLAEKSRISLC